MSTVNIITFSSLLLYVQYHEQPVCTSLLFTLLFIKSQYTVFLFSFFVHLIVFLHILLFFCTSYCFALFYFIAHFILISPFLTICMPLCYVTYIICILIVLHCHWADLIRLHFTSSYALYNYYVTNKETLNLEPWTLNLLNVNYKTKCGRLIFYFVHIFFWIKTNINSDESHNIKFHGCYKYENFGIQTFLCSKYVQCSLFAKGKWFVSAFYIIYFNSSDIIFLNTISISCVQFTFGFQPLKKCIQLNYLDMMFHQDPHISGVEAYKK